MADENTPDAGQAPDGIPGSDTAADSLAEMAKAMADQQIRSTLSQHEKQIADMMATAQKAFDAQSAGLQAQIAQLTGQLAAVRAQAGPPEALLLADSLAARVRAIADANPDLGKLHFAGVTDQAGRLAAAVRAATDGTGTTHEAGLLVQSVTSWFERSHPRASGKVLEGWHAALEELERIAEGLGKLEPVAAAVAAAI
jgi:hypothetical protein